MFWSETSEFLLGEDQLLLFPLFSPNLKRVIVVIHLCSEPVRTCPRPAQGKASRKQGQGFIQGAQLLFSGVCLLCFPREICVLRNDVSIPKHRYPGHLLVVTQVRTSGCGKCSRSWCNCSLSVMVAGSCCSVPGALALGKQLVRVLRMEVHLAYFWSWYMWD